MRILSQFRKDARGNVAMLFGLAALPMLAMVGVGVDYGRALQQRTRLQGAIDAATLIVAQDSTGANDARLQTIADAVIRANMAASGTRITAVNLQSRGGQVEVSVRATMDTSISQVMGLRTLDLSAQAAANKLAGRKTDLYLLLDNSASMGLAATPQGRDRLYALTGCAFACHQPEGGQKKSNLQVAQQNGILTRLDVLRSSVTTLLTRIEADKSPLDTVRVAISSFDDAPMLQTPITTNLALARNYIQNYQLGGNTLFSSAMPIFQSDVGASGDGVASAKKFALIVTDGVQGKRDRSIGFRPFDSTLCTQLKSNGVTVIVLNTEYIPMPAEAAYVQTVMPIQNQLAPALQACASTGYYFSATNQADIVSAFDAIFRSLSAQVFLRK